MGSLPRNGRENQDPANWPAWTDEHTWTTTGRDWDGDDDFPGESPDFTPTPEDAREADFIFGEAAYRGLKMILKSLHDFHVEDTRIGMQEWLENASPDEDTYEEASLTDCHGIYF